MTCGADEVETGVNTEVDLVGTTWLLLLEHVRLVLVVKELDDGLPRVAVVDVVAESGRVDDGESDYKGSAIVSRVVYKHLEGETYP